MATSLLPPASLHRGSDVDIANALDAVDLAPRRPVHDQWRKLQRPLPVEAIRFRRDGAPRLVGQVWRVDVVTYLKATAIVERLEADVPGRWHFTLAALPVLPATMKRQGEDRFIPPFSFIGRLTIDGVTREGVGAGADFKAAETDAFKRAARRFGIGKEIETIARFQVQVDGGGTESGYLEDPAAAYLDRLEAEVFGRAAPARSAPPSAAVALTGAGSAPGISPNAEALRAHVLEVTRGVAQPVHRRLSALLGHTHLSEAQRSALSVHFALPQFRTTKALADEIDRVAREHELLL